MKFYKSFVYSVYSLLKLLRYCKWGLYNSLNKMGAEIKRLIILGNGSSLNEVWADLDFFSADYMVVNRHVLSDSYSKIRPRYYVLADSHFFCHSEGISIIEKIYKETTWEMFLFIPVSSNELKLPIANSNIHIVKYNTVSFRGFNCIRKFLYEHNLSMPIPQNVLVAATYIAVCLHYEKVELYGVEHSWTKNIFVDDENEVCMYNPHFFDQSKVSCQRVKDIQHDSNFTLHFLLRCYAQMFESYWDIQSFAKEKGVKIINKTKGSFIDAFPRF